ncbi:MAG TPA: hypothetical protein VGZ00_10885 [Candidatus Baltobacteraceae bacterium]|jgi:hypothetical protein|nr:hypothetical protein [Candidatus Baltobacteraceae bacterium]
MEIIAFQVNKDTPNAAFPQKLATTLQRAALRTDDRELRYAIAEMLKPERLERLAETLGSHLPSVNDPQQSNRALRRGERKEKNLRNKLAIRRHSGPTVALVSVFPGLPEADSEVRLSHEASAGTLIRPDFDFTMPGTDRRPLGISNAPIKVRALGHFLPGVALETVGDLVAFAESVHDAQTLEDEDRVARRFMKRAVESTNACRALCDLPAFGDRSKAILDDNEAKRHRAVTGHLAQAAKELASHWALLSVQCLLIEKTNAAVSRAWRERMAGGSDLAIDADDVDRLLTDERYVSLIAPPTHPLRERQKVKLDNNLDGIERAAERQFLIGDKGIAWGRLAEVDAARFLDGDVADFRKEVLDPSTRGEIGEIDIETPYVIVEVTTGGGKNEKKYEQVERLLTEKEANPLNKSVILVGSQLDERRVEAIRRLGGDRVYVITEESELRDLINRFRKEYHQVVTEELPSVAKLLTPEILKAAFHYENIDLSVDRREALGENAVRPPKADSELRGTRLIDEMLLRVRAREECTLGLLQAGMREAEPWDERNACIGVFVGIVKDAAGAGIALQVVNDGEKKSLLVYNIEKQLKNVEPRLGERAMVGVNGEMTALTPLWKQMPESSPPSALRRAP